MPDPHLNAPFPYFGGKRKVAPVVWSALGSVRTYIEPFFGSGAVLLQRPNYDATLHHEIANDKCAHICNVWRAIKFNPEETANYCDWPVNHCDLAARNNYLIDHENDLREKLLHDPECYDAKMAGYWIWGMACSVGDKWLRYKITSPTCGGRPQLIGVKKLNSPHTDIYTWFQSLSERLRYVRVVCGEWYQVCGGDWQGQDGYPVGVFFDPPYSHNAGREINIYRQDDDVAASVRQWCLERGQRKSYRIVLAGYTGEHEALAEHGWTFQQWFTNGGYGNQNKNGNPNRHREVLWFSPHCEAQSDLFSRSSSASASTAAARTSSL